jgi:AbrB family looped-hinge helix DNA binding protein
MRYAHPIYHILTSESFGKHAIISEIRNYRISGVKMTTLQIRGKGTITLPASLRKKYNLEEGEVLTLIDLGEGTILLKPMVSEVNKLSRQIAKRLKEENVSLDDLLQALDEERKTYYKKHYAKK